MERVLSSRTFRSGRVAKMTYSETDELDATQQRHEVSPLPTWLAIYLQLGNHTLSAPADKHTISLCTRHPPPAFHPRNEICVLSPLMSWNTALCFVSLAPARCFVSLAL